MDHAEDHVCSSGIKHSYDKITKYRSSSSLWWKLKERSGVGMGRAKIYYNFLWGQNNFLEGKMNC